MFLMEKKVRVQRALQIRAKLGLPYGVRVDCEGRSGGLVLLWSREIDISVKSYSRGHVDALVQGEKKNTLWFITGFYGNPV